MKVVDNIDVRMDFDGGGRTFSGYRAVGAFVGLQCKKTVSDLPVVRDLTVERCKFDSGVVDSTFFFGLSC